MSEEHPTATGSTPETFGLDKGNCYKVAAQLMLKGNEKYVLCHGLKEGQRVHEGELVGHAWIEFGDMVIDNSNDQKIFMKKEDYYKKYKVVAVRHYTLEDTKAMLNKFRHYGAWDDAVKSDVQKEQEKLI